MQDYGARFRASGLVRPLAATLDDVTLEQALFRRDLAPRATPRPLPAWALIAQEKKRKGVTLMLRVDRGYVTAAGVPVLPRGGRVAQWPPPNPATTGAAFTDSA